MKLLYAKFYSRHFDQGRKREKVGKKGRKEEGRKIKLKHSLYLYRDIGDSEYGEHWSNSAQSKLCKDFQFYPS